MRVVKVDNALEHPDCNLRPRPPPPCVGQKCFNLVPVLKSPLLASTHAHVPAVEGAVAALCQTEPDLLKHHPVGWSIWCRAAAQSDVAVETKSVRFR
jgi:hypothetical protein